MRNLVLAIAGMLTALGCRHQPSTKTTLFETISPEVSGITFRNDVHNSDTLNILAYRNFYNGGGVGIGDINNDGLPDIFLVSNMRDNKLYLNQGNFTFRDITTTAGVGGTHFWSTGVTMADVNGDGWLDIYVCNSGNVAGDDRSNELFINNGDNTFTESARAYGLDDKGYSTHAAFFDYDLDGDLDAYIVNNSFLPISKLAYKNLRHTRDSLGGHKLLRNDQNRFTDVSEAAGIYGSVIGFGLGVTVGDIDNDGWPDMFISNDFYEHDYLYINNRDGTFTERVKERMGHLSHASMGADMADINNDGLLDLFVTDMLPGDDRHLKQVMTYEGYDLYALKLSRDYHHQITQNMLQLNNGDGTFREVARAAKVEATDWSWGALMFDMDNDGLKDIFVANGIERDLTDIDFLKFLADETNKLNVHSGKLAHQQIVDRMPSRPVPNCVYRNRGNMQFDNVAGEWGLEGPGFSNGAAYGDLDNDGDLDLVVNNINASASVYRNTTRGGHAISVKLEGAGGNRFGIGARLELYQKGSQRVFEQMPSRGFQSSVDYRMVIAFGDSPQADSILVRWPGGRVQVVKGPVAGSVITLRQADATKPRRLSPPAKPSPIAVDITEQSGLRWRHRESEYVDFYREPLIKQQYSTQGPAVETADLNGDGKVDVVLGGGRGQPLSVWFQQAGVTFRESIQPAFQACASTEVTALALCDVDGDKDVDIFVVTGSGEFDADDPNLADVLLLNDGRGNFSRSDGIPSLLSSGSCMAAADFDRDGDVDFFIGSNVVAGQTGIDAPGNLLVNNGRGQFKNFTRRFFAEPPAGIITGAVWTDLDADNFPELLVVGEWMNVTLYRNSNGQRFTKHFPLPALDGWWHTVAATDADGDGDTDFVLGNNGINSRVRADSLHPAELWISDFDNNGTVEQVMTAVSHDGKNYPLVLKHDLERQLPMIKKRFLKNDDYAGKQIQEIFTADELQKATLKKVHCALSGLLINEGGMRFTWRPFAWEGQLSPVYGVAVAQLSDAARPHLILAGNFFDVLPEIGRYDASFGQIVYPDSATDVFLKPAQTGLNLRGQVRSLKLFTQQGKSYLLVARNNEPVQLFSINPVRL